MLSEQAELLAFGKALMQFLFIFQLLPLGGVFPCKPEQVRVVYLLIPFKLLSKVLKR